MTTYFPFIQPENCYRRAIRTTHRNTLGQNVMATRKALDTYGEITYSYDPFPISSRQHSIIDRHCASMDGGVHSFFVVNWSDPKLVKAIDSKGYITVHNVGHISANEGDGGNRICLWANSGDYGNDSTVSARVMTDTTKSWSTNQWQNHKIMDTTGHVFAIASNTGKTLTVTDISGASLDSGAYDIYRYEDFTVSSINSETRVVTVNASIVMPYSSWNQFVLPVYRSFYSTDTLDFEPSGFLQENSDNYGPLYLGDIVFSQKGTG